MPKSNTLAALNAMKNQVPGLHQKAYQQRQAAADIGLQQALGKPGKKDAGALAATHAAQSGQALVAQRQQAAQQAQQLRTAALQQKQQIGQQALQQKQLAQRARLEKQKLQQDTTIREKTLASRKTVLDSDLAAAARLQRLGIEMDTNLQIATLKQRQDLQRLGHDVKFQLLDSRIMFERDNHERLTMTQPRQLADYIAATAIDNADFNRKMAEVEQLHKLKAYMIERDSAALGRVLTRGYIETQGDLDHEHAKELTYFRRDAAQEIAKAASDAAARAAMFQAFGTVVGTVGGAWAGAVWGGSGGAVYGGAAGAAAGGTAGEGAAYL